MASRVQNKRKFKQWEELPMAVEDTFATLSAVPVDALVTSKKWTQPKIRSDLRRKSTMQAVTSLLCTRNFPSI